MLPQVFGLIRDLFPPDEMGKAWAVLGPVSGLSAVLGPIVAGLLIDADILGTGWRSIFLVNVPVGAFVLYVGGRFLPAGAPAEQRARRLDVTGHGAGRRRRGAARLSAGPGARAGLAAVDRRACSSPRCR